jgi:hypothetical protein
MRHTRASMRSTCAAMRSSRAFISRICSPTSSSRQQLGRRHVLGRAAVDIHAQRGGRHAAHARVDALHVRGDALEPCVHLAHLLAHLQQQAEQLGRRHVLGRATVDIHARLMHLLDLPAELLAAIAAQLAEDDELAFALACRRLRQAAAGTERRAAGARLSTRLGSAFYSVGKLEWAVSSCYLPLSGKLLLRAARAGQLEQLSWLRARGCAWEPCKRGRRIGEPVEGDGMDSCSSAAAGGHLAVLRWARADGCPWDGRTCSAAAG